MKKVWYKRPSYWIWICSVLAIFLVIINVATFYVVHRAYHPSTRTATIENSDNTGRSYKNTITVNHKGYRYTSKKEFTINQNDQSWSYADLKFNKVTIYKLDKEHSVIGYDDQKANCLVVVNMTVKANKDIEIFPDQGTISTNNGLQGKAAFTGDFGDSIDSGVTKTGDVIIPLDGVKNISDLKKLRYKFDGSAKDDNDESDDAFKTVDVQIHLN